MLIAMLASLAASMPGAPNVIGAWEARPVPGLKTITRLTFLEDGRVLGFNVSRTYRVVGDTVILPSRMGDLRYELTKDGMLCAPRGQGLEPITGTSGKLGDYIVCYRKVTTPT
jgi:hypothetical protein